MFFIPFFPIWWFSTWEAKTSVVVLEIGRGLKTGLETTF